MSIWACESLAAAASQLSDSLPGLYGLSCIQVVVVVVVVVAVVVLLAKSQLPPRVSNLIHHMPYHAIMLDLEAAVGQ